MYFNFYKKIILSIVIFGLLTSPSFLSPFHPTIAKAQEFLGTGAGTVTVIGNTDPGTVTAEVAAGTTAAKTVAMFTDRLWQAAKIMIGQRLKKMILDAIVDRAVKWIKNGGFEGKGGPIVEDWGAFFNDIGDQAAGEVLEATVPLLCGSFKLNLAASLTQEPKTLEQRSKCTLEDIGANVNKIFENFKEESHGKWITYNTLWEPQNNFWGSAQIAEDAKQNLVTKILTSKNVEATVNLGFKSQKKCTIDKQTGKEKCDIVTPGSTIGKQIQETIMPKDNAILSASDLATYIGALADAVLYRYTILGANEANGGLAKLLGYKESDKKPKDYSTAMADAVEANFNQIDNITFQNNKALFIDEITSYKKIKESTLDYLNQSINTENDLISLKNLGILPTCAEPDNGWTSEESSLMTQAIEPGVGIIADITADTIPNLTGRQTDTQGEIDDLEAIIDEFNGYTSDADNMVMLSTYSALVSQGHLDAGAAATILADTQTEFNGFQESSKEMLESPTPDGYLNLINYCKDPAHQISSETP